MYARGFRTLAVAALLPMATAALADDAPRRTISVTGNGEVKVPPDLAVVSFAVETTAATAGAAVVDNARKSSQLAEALKRQIGSSGKVVTTRYSLDPVYEQRDRGAALQPPRITGYVARNQVRAETSAIDSVGKLIDAATQAGANRVDNLAFTLEQRGPAQSEALKRAGEDARRQAEAAAAALGVKLGPVQSATTGPHHILPPQPLARMAMAAEMGAPTPVEAGDVTVPAMLQVTYEIE